jgi:large subunit ribosomal protein L15
MPLQRRIPKFGFKNPNRIEYKAINLDTIQGLVDASKEQAITIELLVANGLVGKNDLVKVLGRGDLTAKVDVSAHKFSTTASESIEKAGGKVVIVK